MKVETYLFGSVEVSPEKVISFPDGLVAFPDAKRFMLAHEVDQGRPSSFTLQSLDDPMLALQIVDPATLDLAGGFDCLRITTGASNVANITSARIITFPTYPGTPQSSARVN